MEVVLSKKEAISYNNVSTKYSVTEIIKNYRSRLLAFIRKRVHTAQDAEDILQDVFFQLIEAERYTKPIDQMAAWLFTVARNRIIDSYRKKKTEPFPLLPPDDDVYLLDELMDELFDNGNTPETEYLRSLVWVELNSALAELPSEQRMVFEMTEIQGFSFKDIAKQTGVPVNTLISRKRYAVLHLRERLQLLYDEFLNF